MRAGSLAVTFYDEFGTKLVNADTIELGRIVALHQGRTVLGLRIHELHLRPGRYIVGLWLAEATGSVHDHVPTALQLEVTALQESVLGASTPGLVSCHFDVREIGAEVVA